MRPTQKLRRYKQTIVSLWETLRHHEETIDALQQKVADHETTIDTLQQDAMTYEDTIDTLQQDLCQQTIADEETIRDLQEELCKQAIVNEDTVNTLQEELYTRSMIPECNHAGIIASLQEQLYYTKIEVESYKRKFAITNQTRIDTILLNRLDSNGIPNKDILRIIRESDPRVRRADLYQRLGVLQKQGLIKERSDKVWVLESNRETPA